MQNKQKLIELKTKIPYGGIQKIARHSGSSRIATLKFFKGELKNQKKIQKIQNSIRWFFKELQDSEDQFYKDIENL